MTQFDITDDNRPYLEARGKIVLNACPGSGKTSAVAYKIIQLSDECVRSYGAYAGIACLSFTNVAKDEITAKFSGLTGSHLTYPHEVSTLDSFINRYVTLPFYYLLGRPSKRPYILDVVSFLDEMNLGYFQTKSGQPLAKIFRPSQLNLEMDGSITWNGIIPKPQTVHPSVFQTYSKTFKKWQLDNGYLDNGDSAYIAYKLLKAYPQIAKSLVGRFPYVIIDEAQDTSEIQYAIFDLLIEAGLANIEYVGDPYQSLYEFREARPDLFLQRFGDTKNWQPLLLKNCRRTSQQIINSYSRFRRAEEAPITSTANHASDHPLKVLRYDPQNLQELVSQYATLVDPRLKNYVLVRGTTHLEMFGVKPSSEEPWKNSATKKLISAQMHYVDGNTKRAVDDLRMFLSEVQLPSADHRQRRDHQAKLKEDTDINIQLFDFLRDMPTINDGLKDWTEKITVHVKEKFDIDVNLGLKQKGKAFYEQNLKSLLFPSLNISYPVSTIHKIKGMTFQSVLLVLSKDSRGANISLTDFAKPTAMPSEKQRMIYVALSRPETLACLAVPNSLSEAQVTEVLGSGFDFV